MSFSATLEQEAAALKVDVTEDELIVQLVDGRKVSVPIAWYPRLLHGTSVERSTCELMGRGTGIHWPLLDEDISVAGILKGRPSGESPKSLKRWLDGRK
ncbi:MAG: DUF2442 domain-containing protein [Patescibacteria group bacterium]|nr:DUF2442 domain-containing protein [Patescibacteria group bacterium]